MRAVAWIAILMLANVTLTRGREGSPRESFDFLYADGRGTRLDTYHGTITKDMIDLPDRTVACFLSEADVDSVRERMIEIHFFDMREPYPAISSDVATSAQTW